MNLIISNHEFRYETEKVVRIFFPNEKIVFFNEQNAKEGKTGEYIFTDVSRGTVKVEIKIGDFYRSSERCVWAESDSKKQYELEIASQIYIFLCEYCGFVPQWGIMTGIRPAKLFRNLEKKFGFEEAERILIDDYFISDDKLQLCERVAKEEEMIISSSNGNSFSLYISIPFCPSRCRYCSFVSHSVEKTEKLIPEYLEKLTVEIKMIADLSRKLCLSLESVYIGGGTPTTLSSEQMKTLLKCIGDNFDIHDGVEFTVEAGRPDTLNREMLEVIKDSKCTRISINPQTFNDEILMNIGRRHTADQAIKAFDKARSIGFDNINMDLIAGLEGESFDSFVNSVKSAVSLSPESITIHSLSLKSSSDLVTEYNAKSSARGEGVTKMLSCAYSVLSENGYIPYYMYRQSKTVGNLENTGWAKRGKFCRYNIFMMDETHTVLAAGAGAVTKLREPCGDYIERIYNFKYPYEYISRFDELMTRKGEILDFYGKYRGLNGNP